MGTQGRFSPPGYVAVALLLVSACTGQGGSVASRTPAASSTPAASGTATPSSTTASPAASSPQPVAGAYGVLVSQAANSYTVVLVGIDGKVAASADATPPPIASCGGAAGAPVPLPVSTSNSRAYFMDAQGAVRYISPSRETGRATTVPASTGSRRSMFAVSPDDARIAVVVDDYTATGASTRLYAEDLNGGGNHVELFTESGSRTLWPVGWHGTNNLVLAVVPSCTQGGGPFCCGPQELHVVDPLTATRRFTLGGVTSCPIVGPASPAGVICWDGTNSKVLNWTAGTVRTYPVQGPAAQLLSPDGGLVAVVDNGGTSVQNTNVAWPGMFACTWIDGQHVLSSGDPQHQPRIGEFPSGVMTPVAAQGDCGGRIPGSL